jgi:hypothetical protein
MEKSCRSIRSQTRNDDNNGDVSSQKLQHRKGSYLSSTFKNLKAMSIETPRVGAQRKQVIGSIAQVKTEVRSHSHRKRLLGPTYPSFCRSVCPSFRIYRCHSLWEDFSEILTQGTFMEIWRVTANFLLKLLKISGVLHMGTELHFIVAGDINSP